MIQFICISIESSEAMKKIVIIILCLVIIISSSMLGYLVVSANTEVKIEDNIIDRQNEQIEYLKSYGYTLDNPNVILNPYDISPLTALIIFETNDAVPVSITVVGKNSDSSYTKHFEKSKVHYIPVYGLYADYNNKIIIKCQNTEKVVEIKTEKLPKELSNTKTNNTGDTLFIADNNLPYALDKDGEVRWYLTKKYTGKIEKLSNDNLFLGSDKKDENDLFDSILEIDLLGKIYKEYKIDEGYTGSYIELENSYLILSKDLLEIDKQNGEIITRYKLDSQYDNITLNDNIVILSSTNSALKIDLNTKKQAEITFSSNKNERENNIEFYTKNKNYKLSYGTSFAKKSETETSKESLLLINYKNPDDNYKKYDIKLMRETDRLVVSGKFEKEDKVYVILDKFMDKKIYDVDIKENTTYKYINSTNLEGKYSIYLKINDKLYKTNKYVNF